MKTRLWILLAGVLALTGGLLAGCARLHEPASRKASAATPSATSPSSVSAPLFTTEPSPTETTTTSTTAQPLEMADVQAAVRAAYPSFDPAAFQVRTTDAPQGVTYIDFSYVLDGVDTPYGYTVTVSGGEIAAIHQQMPTVEVNRTPKPLTPEQEAAFIEQAKTRFAAEHPNWLLQETTGKQRFDPASGKNEYIVTVWHSVQTPDDWQQITQANGETIQPADGGWVYTFDF